MTRRRHDQSEKFHSEVAAPKTSLRQAFTTARSFYRQNRLQTELPDHVFVNSLSGFELFKSDPLVAFVSLSDVSGAEYDQVSDLVEVARF